MEDVTLKVKYMNIKRSTTLLETFKGLLLSVHGAWMLRFWSRFFGSKLLLLLKCF